MKRRNSLTRLRLENLHLSDKWFAKHIATRILSNFQIYGSTLLPGLCNCITTFFTILICRCNFSPSPSCALICLRFMLGRDCLRGQGHFWKTTCTPLKLAKKVFLFSRKSRNGFKVGEKWVSTQLSPIFTPENPIYPFQPIDKNPS